MRTVIIEDEINAFEYLRDLSMEVIPNMRLMHHLDSVEDSINWFHNNRDDVDLIFLDIQLSDGLSFEIFNHVDITSPIIFTTAYDDYAIKAFKLNSIDYLLKPVIKEDLQSALKKLDKTQSSPLNQYDIRQLLNAGKSSKRNRFLVKRGNYFEFVNVEEVAFIHSEDSLTFIYLNDGKRHLYNETVANLEQELDESVFFQINRKQIVNINSVVKIHPYLNQRLKLDLGRRGGNVDFIVSRNRTMEFKHWVDR